MTKNLGGIFVNSIPPPIFAGLALLVTSDAWSGDATEKHEKYTSKTYESEMPYTIGAVYLRDGIPVSWERLRLVRCAQEQQVTVSAGIAVLEMLRDFQPPVTDMKRTTCSGLSRNS